MKKWKCRVCGYLHEGENPPVVCPVCGVSQEEFELLHEEEDIQNRIYSNQFLRVVIIGGGAAGMEAIETLCRLTANVKITLISEEQILPYWRMNLTRYLAGEVSYDSLFLRGQEWFKEKDIELYLGRRVIEINREQRYVVLDSSERIHYDRLLLATGADAWRPPVPGILEDRVHTLRSLVDAQRLLDLALPGSHCVALGGGILGLEIAGALARRGVQVVIVEQTEWLMPRQLPKIAATCLQKVVEKMGIQVIFGKRVERIVSENGKKKVYFGDSQDYLTGDWVSVTVGVRPRVELAQQCGLVVNRGIVVDDFLCTSDPSIYAAGDCSEYKGNLCGLWVTAQSMGSTAALNLVLSPKPYEPKVPPVRLKVLGCPVLSWGNWQNPGEKVWEGEIDDQAYMIGVNQNQIQCAIVVGHAADAKMLEEMANKRVVLPSSIIQLPTIAQVLNALREFYHSL